MKNAIAIVFHAALVFAPSIAVAQDGSRIALICGIEGLLGEALSPIRGDDPGCSIDAPIRVSSIDGVAVEPGAIMDCDMAASVRRWIDEGIRPSFRGGPELAGISVKDDYNCRVRTGSTSRLSTHSVGRGLDISGFELADGKTVSILDNWGSPDFGDTLSRIHQSACDIYPTVAGPAYKDDHSDHFHIDIGLAGAEALPGSFCR